MNGQWYESELKPLKETVRLKRRGNLKAVVLLLQDNTPFHTSQVSVAEAANRGFKLLVHPPYLPHLDATYFFLLPRLPSHILEIMVRLYVLWKSFWKTRIPSSSMMGLQCLALRETILKNSKKKSCLVSAMPWIYIYLRGVFYETPQCVCVCVCGFLWLNG